MSYNQWGLWCADVICTRHDGFIAGHTFGGELVAVAVVAQKSIVLAGEGLVGQRTVAAETAEAVFMVVTVLVKQLLNHTTQACYRTF